MEKDFNDFQNGYNMNYQNGFDMNDPMFNPIVQYEQAYTYYKYLCMQMDYKIKCKEYEKLCADMSSRNLASNAYSNNTPQNKST